MLTQAFEKPGMKEWDENEGVYAKGEGTEKLYVDEILGNKKYKLRKTETKGGEVLAKEFVDADLKQTVWE